MKLNRLSLTNWGPYRGSHQIDLSVSEAAPVVLIHGENMRGKTSLLRAINWSLYGEMKNQDGKTPLSVARLVNRVDLDSMQEISFGVELEFEHRGYEYSLSRTALAQRFQPGELPSTRDTSVTLRQVDGNPMPENAVAPFIEDMLSHEIADFFFFDGEMLGRFEERLREDTEGSKNFVRIQIERALGLPFMRSLESDLEKIRNDVRLDVNRNETAQRRNQDQLQRVAGLEDDLRSATSDLDRLENLRIVKADQVDDIDRDLASVDEIKEKYYELKSRESDLGAKEQQILVLQEEALALHEKSWWFPLGNRLAEEHAAAATKMTIASGHTSARSRLELRIADLLKQRSQSECISCGQRLPEAKLAPLEQKLKEMEAELADIPESDDLPRIQERLSHLQPYVSGPAVVTQIINLDRERLREELDIDSLKARIRDLSDAMPGIDLDIASKERARRSLKDEISNLDKACDAQRLRVQNLKQHIKEVTRAIVNDPNVDKTLRSRYNIVEDVYETIKASYSEFSQQMRSKVQAETSQLFRQLTTEAEFSGVSINSNYQLSIMDKHSKHIDLTSAGGNQVLTMSFIGALAECSSEEAPVVMDTPFGRLDKGHREAVLRWVSASKSQIIMFVQSGEYDVKRDGQFLAGKVGREYRIERISEQESMVV